MINLFFVVLKPAIIIQEVNFINQNHHFYEMVNFKSNRSPIMFSITTDQQFVEILQNTLKTFKALQVKQEKLQTNRQTILGLLQEARDLNAQILMQRTQDSLSEVQQVLQETQEFLLEFQVSLQKLLRTAVELNKLECVESLVTQTNVSVDIQMFDEGSFFKSRLIHYAVEKGNLEIIILLLSRFPQLNHCTHEGETALAISVKLGRLDIAEALLNAGADVNASGTFENPYLPTTSGITALHFAALKGNVPMMQLLLSRGADVNAIKTQVKNTAASHDSVGRLFRSANQNGQETALDMVRRAKHVDAEAFLIAQGAESAIHNDRRSCVIM